MGSRGSRNRRTARPARPEMAAQAPAVPSVPPAGEVATVETLDGIPVPLVNATGGAVPTAALSAHPAVREVAGMIGQWRKEATRVEQRNRARMFAADQFLAPDNPYDLLRTCRDAAEGDAIVSGVREVTGAIMFNKVAFEDGNNPDEADVWNQWAAEVNLDDALRKIGNEDFEIEQAVIALEWDWQEYTPRGKGDGGRTRRKAYKAWMPTSISVTDAQYVVPVGTGPIGPKRLAWMADHATMEEFVNSPADDPMRAFYKGKYTPRATEMLKLQDIGVNTSLLIELAPQYVFRHVAGLQDYKIMPTPRIASCLRELDLKRQLMDADRASLVANANFIVQVTIGTDAQPGKQTELAQMKKDWQYMAKSSVVFGDHRLNIEIVAPARDFTLDPEKYQELNRTILNRLLGTPQGIPGSDVPGAGKFIATTLENRRHMIKRSIERHIVRAVVEHPNNKGVFKGQSNLVFGPRQITVDTDQVLLKVMSAARDKREISRDTFLEFLGLDQSAEALRMAYEAEVFDDIFKTRIPHDAANGQPPSSSGGEGGRPTGGGGTADETKPGDVTTETKSGAKSTKGNL